MGKIIFSLSICRLTASLAARNEDVRDNISLI